MSHEANREKIITRLSAELIGPGSDLFCCEPTFSDEIIEGKPLQRYFSAILFPKQDSRSDINSGEDAYSEIDNPEESSPEDIELPTTEEIEAEKDKAKDEIDENDNIPKYNSNTFYPSNFGFSFGIAKECEEISLTISFGNYKKAKPEEISLPYSGADLNLINDYGFHQFVTYDEANNRLKLSHAIKFKENGQSTPDYLALQAAFKALAVDHRNSFIIKLLTKLLFKDKYKRYDNKIVVTVKVSELLLAENNHKKFILSEQFNAKPENWHKDNRENLLLHLKLYDNGSSKYFIKAIIENNYSHKKAQFSISKEKLNQLALFQTEIQVNNNFLLPFRDYRPHTYKSSEDKMLDYLFKDKLAYGIGHNTACTWENLENDSKKPSWIKTTFLPSYNVKSQSTETDKIDKSILGIKSLSSFGLKKIQVIQNLKKIVEAYSTWIEAENNTATGNTFGEENILKCKSIRQRIANGIRLLEANDKAFHAFQLANTAIYIQMFQSELHFNKKDGYEVFENNMVSQLDYAEYSKTEFPNGKAEPIWRPFQLAFILQCIPSFVETDSSDKDLVDLLYFPTGGGKTEAYLAVSAFLIFWRRMCFPNEYDGVNIIIRYTLRLLSAQQFERATKLILACEFIRQNTPNLGEEKISIGFWIGTGTIPNSIEEAEFKLKKLLERLNGGKFDGKRAINPFQLTNCQWCNTKIISRIKSTDLTYSIGHRISRRLQSHCLNPNCTFSEHKGGLPIVLIDDDIYKKPPTVLFGTIDKFAALAWKEEATTLFNYKGNRKPELIIQDELHLLNGPLGSLTGLFENVILSLCKTENQRPKVIASTATIKNVEAQILGIYGRQARIFPQYVTNSDDTFFSKTLESSKRKYLGILPTGKTPVMTNLHLLTALLYARLEIWEASQDKTDADQFWTLLSYFKSLKEVGRFSNKISSELKPIIQQLQVKYLKNHGNLMYNYLKLSYRNLELTSRIPNEKIKKNLDKLDIQFDGSLNDYKAYDLVLATNMISVGLDVGRLGIMIMNGMPPNTAEYIQASSRVARKNEGLVVTMFDPFNTRDLSYFEDFAQFHKTFYKQVEPLSVTPFADSALDKMLFTLMVAFFRHKMGHAINTEAASLIDPALRVNLQNEFLELFRHHPYAKPELDNISRKSESLIQNWKYKIDAVGDLKFFWSKHEKESLLKSIQEKMGEEDILVAMNSMRNVEPSAEITIKQQ